MTDTVEILTAAIHTLGRGCADDESSNEYRRKCAEAVRVIADNDADAALTQAVMRCGPALYAAAIHTAASSVMGPDAVGRVMHRAAELMQRRARHDL